MSHHSNITRIKAVHNALADLQNKVVYVGGATVSLYADRLAFETRPTDDIDVIIELLNYSSRSELEEKLRQIGFSHDIESGVICRYKIQGIIVDIMPTDDKSIGFSNIWYPEGFAKAINYVLDEYITIKILSPPLYLATKLEAFKDRGKGDGRTSQDFEDIVFVLENRQQIWTEIQETEGILKEYLLNEFTGLIKNPYIQEWIDSHVERGITPPATPFIINAIRDLIN